MKYTYVPIYITYRAAFYIYKYAKCNTYYKYPNQ